MKILLSAYTCAPGWGSEPGIGWNFATHLTNQNHEVVVLTNHWSRSQIEQSPNQDYQRISFLYYDLPEKVKRNFFRGTGPLAHIYYFFWQIGAYLFVKNYLKENQVDLIHHITLGVFRTPSFLSLLDVPFIFGPVGGGEHCPSNLSESLPFSFRIKEKIRTYSNYLSKFNPLLNLCYKNSDLIILKTSDNLRFIPKKFHSKCEISLEIGIDYVHKLQAKEENPKKIRILFAGRLLYWKGVHLAIKSYAKVLKYFPDVEFTIVGSEGDEAWVKGVAESEAVYEKIQWIPRVKQAELFKMYQDFDFLLFPSLHDSSGGVVLEAISFGLPVICLDLGGPKEIVDNNCGCIISTSNKSEEEVIQGLMEAINLLVLKPELLSTMRENALEKAKEYSWEKVTRKVYSLIEEKKSKLRSVI